MSRFISSRMRLAEALGRAAAAAPGPAPNIILASKGRQAAALLPLLAAGHRSFGENRVGELREKWPVLKARFPATELHMIGVLQTGKLKQALGLVDMLHTLASENLARALAAAQARGQSVPRLLLQVNLAKESHKPGLHPEKVASFLALLASLGLRAEGLMALPPKDKDPAPYFAQLAAMAQHFSLPLRSMGMSGDYERAARAGATHLRLGREVLGPRG